MCALRSAVIGAIFVLLVGTALLAATDQDASPPAPTTVASFPGTLYSVLQNLDGSAVCFTTEGVFLPAGDLHRWSAVPDLPRASNNFGFRPVGGDRTCFFAVDSVAGMKRQMAEHPRGDAMFGVSYPLEAVNADGKVSIVREKMPRGSCAFASKDVGIIAWSEDIMGPNGGLASVRKNLVLTVDGGRTWKPLSAQLLGTAFDQIDRLFWVSPSRLLIASTGGSVQLFERMKDQTLGQRWSATVSGYSGRRNFALDGDYVWVDRDDKQVSRLRLADGRIDATVKVNASEKGSGGVYDWRIAACHQRLIVWGCDRAPPLAGYITA